MYGGLFDRLGTDDDGDPSILAVELADLLGARRVFDDPRLGVLSWGMSPLSSPTQSRAADRRYIAECIADAIHRFEPRLENVDVAPVADTQEFCFLITATLVNGSSTIQLHIFSPYADGGFGAKVEVVHISDDLELGAAS